MNPLPLSPALSARVQQLIDTFPEGTDLGSRGLAHDCRELNALPLYGRALYVWMLRPDGVVLCVDYEPFRRPADPEENFAHICTALYHGTNAYPELRELFEQVRPQAFQLCLDCGGTGLRQRGDGTTDYCWGCDSRAGRTNP